MNAVREPGGESHAELEVGADGVAEVLRGKDGVPRETDGGPLGEAARVLGVLHPGDAREHPRNGHAVVTVAPALVGPLVVDPAPLVARRDVAVEIDPDPSRVHGHGDAGRPRVEAEREAGHVTLHAFA